MEKLFISILLSLLMISCISSRNQRKNHKPSAIKTFQNVNTKDCSWVYKNEILNRKQIDSVKKIILENNNSIKIRTVSSIMDTLNKYHINGTCVVILE
jgi:hypothetical protein